VVRDYRDRGERRIEIVTLCGSTRFRAMFDVTARELTKAGVIVLGPAVWTHNGDRISDDEKTRLDWLHLRKIDLSNRVHVINVNGYIGDSTRNEIAYALSRGIPVTYLETPPAGEE
jgi:hypothetical protein